MKCAGTEEQGPMVTAKDEGKRPTEIVEIEEQRKLLSNIITLFILSKKML